MPVIRIEMFPGRTAEQKRALASRVTEAFIETAGGKPESVHVLISEIAQDHWAVGGELCSERAKAKP